MNGNTSVLYLQEIDNFTDDQLLRILQELKTEFEELKRSDIHQESLIIPAFAFSLVGIVLAFCLCKKDYKTCHFSENAVYERNRSYQENNQILV